MPVVRRRGEHTSDDFDEAREAAHANIKQSDDEDLFCENYMREIMESGEKGDKRNVTILLADGLDSNRPKLRTRILTILALSSERLGVKDFNQIYSYDLTNIKAHLKVLKILSVRNPMEYSEEFLKYNIIVLSKCIQEMSPVLIEDFKKDEKFISWKKVIGILKHFMAMNKEEDIKLACCSIFLLLTKNKYYDDLVEFRY